MKQKERAQNNQRGHNTFNEESMLDELMIISVISF